MIMYIHRTEPVHYARVYIMTVYRYIGRADSECLKAVVCIDPCLGDKDKGHDEGGSNEES